MGPEAAPLVAAALGVTREGNFEGANILTRPWSREELAARFALQPDRSGAPLGSRPWRGCTRCGAKRVPPHRDEKVIVAWNGLTHYGPGQGRPGLGRPALL